MVTQQVTRWPYTRRTVTHAGPVYFPGATVQIEYSVVCRVNCILFVPYEQLPQLEQIQYSIHSRFPVFIRVLYSCLSGEWSWVLCEITRCVPAVSFLCKKCDQTINKFDPYSSRRLFRNKKNTWWWSPITREEGVAARCCCTTKKIPVVAWLIMTND